MISSLLLRVSIVLLLVGLCFGIVMGARQDFTLAPAHAHLNLTGFVVPFLAGLYYRAFPSAERSGLAKIQAWLAIIGGILFPAAIAAELGIGHQFGPLIIAGSFLILAAAALFAVIVFRTTAGARTA